MQEIQIRVHWPPYSLQFTCLPLFLLHPLSLSFHPVHSGKQSGSEGWINKGVKVEHNSLRSAFSGTLTQRNTQTHAHANTIYIKTLTHTCILLVHYWGDEMRRGGVREKTIHTSHHLHAPALEWEGHEERERGSEEWRRLRKKEEGRVDGRARATWGGGCMESVAEGGETYNGPILPAIPPLIFPFFSSPLSCPLISPSFSSSLLCHFPFFFLLKYHNGRILPCFLLSSVVSVLVPFSLLSIYLSCPFPPPLLFHLSSPFWLWWICRFTLVSCMWNTKSGNDTFGTWDYDSSLI